MTADELIRYNIHRKYEMVRDSEIDTAIKKGERIGRAEERQVWQGVVADQAAALADKDALIAQLKAKLGEA